MTLSIAQCTSHYVSEAHKNNNNGNDASFPYNFMTVCY